MAARASRRGATWTTRDGSFATRDARSASSSRSATRSMTARRPRCFARSCTACRRIRNVDASLRELAERQFNARLGAYRDAFTSRGHGTPALRLAQNLLAFAGGPIRGDDPVVQRGGEIVAEYARRGQRRAARQLRRGRASGGRPAVGVWRADAARPRERTKRSSPKASERQPSARGGTRTPTR